MLVVGAIGQLVLERIGEIFLGLDMLWGIGPVLLGSGLAWLGYTLWSSTPESIGVRRAPRIVGATRSVT